MPRSNAVSIRQALAPLQWESLLKQYLALRRADGISAGTIDMHTQYTRRFFREYPDALSCPDRLRECVYDHLGGKELTAVTHNIRKLYVGRFIEWVRMEGYIPENPFNRFKRRKEPSRIVTVKPDVLRRLLEAPDRTRYTGVRDYGMFVTMLDTGIRPQEVRKLVPEDVDLEEGYIRIRPEVSKTKTPRTLPLTAPSLAAIRKLLSVRPPEWKGSTLFCCEDGHPMTANTITRIMLGYRQKIGVTDLPAYALRHSFCTQMMRSGANMDTIRQMMGHADFRILKGYMHLDDDDVKREHEAHSPLLTILPQSGKRVRKV